MKFEDIKPKKGSTKERVRVGRGNASGLGGEAGRGHKGAKSRSGYSKKFGFEGGQTPLYRRMPKKRGFKNFNKEVFSVINIGKIETLITKFKDLKIIDILILKEKGLIPKNGVKLKVLGFGEITNSITIKAHAFSKSAIDKLEKVKAKAEIIK